MDEHQIEHHWKQIFDTVNDGLFLVGPDGAILMVNKAFERLTGYKARELLGRPCTMLRCDACESALRKQGASWCTLFKHGKNVRKRCVVVRKDGTYLPAIKTASVLRTEEGAPLAAVETLTDLSHLDRLGHEVDQLARQLDMEEGYHGIVGKSPVMERAFQVIEKAAQSDAPVIIYGESGTGKDLTASAIHQAGRRKEGPFVHFNCAALNEALIESELFGHVRGAFTGAYRHRMGRFEAAHGGDLFLDEIGDIPPSTQMRLLRVLEKKEFERVGDHRPIGVDVRIITATNKDLHRLIAERRFREDLFFRINVIPIHLPPLRERKEDIPLLLRTFIQRMRAGSGKDITGLTPAAMDRLMAYSWPGNVRELKSALEYAFVIAHEGLIDPAHLPQQFRGETGFVRTEATASGTQAPEEKAALMVALQQSGGNQSEAARILGVSRVTVWNRMRKHGLTTRRILSS
jgi:PAS domain S-box-containing protein